MKETKTTTRVLYEELRLLVKDTSEAVKRIKRIATRSDTHYIFVNDHIGDVVIVLGYLGAFREKHNLNRIAIVLHEKFRDFAPKYSDYYDELILVDSMTLYRSFLIGDTRYGDHFLKTKFSNVTLVNPADSFLRGYDYAKRYPELNLVSVIRHGCLQLENDSEFITPRELDKKNTGEKESKNIIFSIDSRTISGDIADLCETLTEKLRNLGYTLYTNTDDSTKVIRGTKPIFLGIGEIGSFVEGGAFIGIRTGLHDLLAFYDCSVVALYLSQDENTTFFSLDALPGRKANCMEMVKTSKVQNDSDKVISFIVGNI